MKKLVCVDGPRMGTVVEVMDSVRRVDFLCPEERDYHYTPGECPPIPIPEKIEVYRVELLRYGNREPKEILMYQGTI